MQKKPLEQEDQDDSNVRKPHNKQDQTLLGVAQPDEINLKEESEATNIAEEDIILKKNIEHYNEEIGKDIEEDNDRNTGSEKTSGKFKTPQDLE